MGRIVKICRKCGGNKWKLTNGKQIKFRPCNKCPWAKASRMERTK